MPNSERNKTDNTKNHKLNLYARGDRIKKKEAFNWATCRSFY